jgi:hypothetical protein
MVLEMLLGIGHQRQDRCNMKIIRSRGVVVVTAAALFSLGCESAAQYSGDGKLVDNGRAAVTDRYVLDLGSVSLKKTGSATFRFKNLPKENFVVGLELRAPEGSNLNGSSINPTIEVSLTENGVLLIEKAGKLSGWTWSIQSPGSRAFVYGRENPSTYFDSVPGKDYQLTFRVRDPDQGKAKYTAFLVAKSGGWK